MCRSIHTLYHLDPAATEVEITEAAVQYVRKVSGYNKPSKKNEAAFMTAVEEISMSSAKLLAALETNAPFRERALVTKHPEGVTQKA